MFQKLKDLFIPCTENGFKPNFLERVSVAVMLLLVLLSFTAANIQALLWIGSEWMVSTILPAVIVDLTNEERGGEDLTVLRRNELLDRAAQLKAEDMAQNEYFAHYSPTGVSPWYWFEQVSYNYVHAGENLAVHFTDSSDVVEAWMKSPSHKANILNNSYTEIGVGTAKGEYKGFPTIFVVQLFGTPNAVAATTNAEIAGATIPSNDISLETVTFTEETTASNEEVAPATIETITTAPEQPQEDELVIDPERAEAVPNTGESLEISPVVSTDAPSDTVVLYSDLATTSRPGVPATLEETGNTTGSNDTHTSIFARGATQPSMVLQIVYSILALFVFVALILSIVIEWRRQHPIQIAYAGGLLAIMALLFHIHTALTSGVTIV